MYSVKSSGNNTLSCNAGSTRSPPECPWVARKYRNCLGRVWVQAILKPFLWSSSLLQTSYPNVNWPLRSTIELCVEFFHNIVNRPPPSSSQGIDGSCRSNLIMTFDTIQQSLRNLSGLISIQFLSRTGIEMGDCVTVGFGRGFAFATGFPATLCSTFSREMVFWRFGYVFVNSIYISNPWFRYRNVLDEGRPSHPRPGRLSCFRGNVNSRHRFFTSSGPSSSSVMKNCPFSTIFKPASEHSLDNFWSLGSCSNLCSYLAAGFPATPRWCEDHQQDVL